MTEPHIKPVKYLDDWLECEICGCFVTNPLRHTVFHRYNNFTARIAGLETADLDKAVSNGPVTLGYNDKQQIYIDYKTKDGLECRAVGDTLAAALAHLKTFDLL